MILFLNSVSLSISAHTRDSTSHNWFPVKSIVTPLLFDPIEAQSFGYLTRKRTEGASDRGVYAPFGIGFLKPIVGWGNNKQLIMDVAVFTQFDMFGENSKFHRYMRNADYKLSLSYVWLRADWQFRLRGFHVSSHLGDDYLVQNGLETFKNNPVNYEQIDFVSMYKYKSYKFYGGVGYGVRPSFRPGNERKRLSFQAGLMYKKKAFGNCSFVAGFDTRILEQNRYFPSTKVGSGIGIDLPNDRKAFYFMIELYRGNTPYGKFESQRCSWIGIGFNFQP